MRFGLLLQIVKRMDNEIKKKAKSFLKEYGLQNVTLENLRAAIQKQGYTIVEYNNIFNDENVAALIDALGLENFCERSKGFTYADTKRRLVFLHEDLSDKEKLMILAHEEGHIYCNHLTSTPVLGRDVVEEHEANEFAHYLLNQGFGQRIIRFIQTHRVGAIAVAIAVLSCLPLSDKLFCTVRRAIVYNQPLKVLAGLMAQALIALWQNIGSVIGRCG